MKMKIRISDNETNVTIELSAEELIQINDKGIDIGSLFGTDFSASSEEVVEDEYEFFFDGELKKDINPPEKEETKFLCHTGCDGGFCSEKTGFVKAWLDQNKVSYEKCDGTFSKYIKYELKASQLKELMDLLTKNDHLTRGVFI
jgi:hypothetical protein